MAFVLNICYITQGKGADRARKANPAPQKTPAGKRKRTSTGSARGSQYTELDWQILNECMREILPIGSKDWELVHQSYNNACDENGRPHREVKSLIDRSSARKSQRA